VGEAGSSTAEFLALAIEGNVRQTIADILESSEVIPAGKPRATSREGDVAVRGVH
jgi:hypothetical protein